MRILNSILLLSLCAALAACGSDGGNSPSDSGATGEKENIVLKDVTDTSSCVGTPRNSSPYNVWKIDQRGVGERTGTVMYSTIRMELFNSSTTISHTCVINGVEVTASVSVLASIDTGAKTITVLEEKQKTTYLGNDSCSVSSIKSMFKYELVGNCMKVTNGSQSQFMVAD